jgi:hypothetical protein
MTSLLAWVGVDARGPASIYMASDSRISWGSKAQWNYGRKLFASTKHPDIIGYVGDVLFPSLVLGQIIDLIDNGVLFNSNDTPQERLEKLKRVIQTTYEYYPNEARQAFTVLYGTRERDKLQSVFHMFTLEFSTDSSDCKVKPLQLPNTSSHIHILGSGKNTVSRHIQVWQKSSQGGTSRSVFSAFCDSLTSGEDTFSGGVPQLVGLYRINPASAFGIIYNNERYLLGLPVDETKGLEEVEWRNELFERCNWKTKQPLAKAQKQPRPNDL